MESTSPGPTSTAAGKVALVVAAEPDVTDMLGTILKPEEWSVVHAPDNRVAFEIAKAGPFELIITGARTTCREDIGLLREIRRIRAHVRFIILTDQHTPADVIAAMREGAFSYFSMPLSTAALAEIVRMATLEPAWDDGIELVSATPEWISVIVRCDQATADRLVHFLCEMLDLPGPERNDVATAFREMLLNAIEHGGNFDPSQYVEVGYVRARNMVLCRIKDPGQGFSLWEIHHAAINNPTCDPIRHALLREAQGLRPGGYGVLLAKHLVDELIYSERGNEVLLIKYLSPQRVGP